MKSLKDLIGDKECLKCGSKDIYGFGVCYNCYIQFRQIGTPSLRAETKDLIVSLLVNALKALKDAPYHRNQAMETMRYRGTLEEVRTL